MRYLDQSLTVDFRSHDAWTHTSCQVSASPRENKSLWSILKAKFFFIIDPKAKED